MANGSIGYIVGAIIVGLMVGGTLTYVSTSVQIDKIEKSISDIRKEVAQRPAPQQPASSTSQPVGSSQPPVKFVLRSAFLTDKGYRWFGKEGDIAGLDSPKLSVKLGQQVTIEVVNDDGIEHNFVIPDLGVTSKSIVLKGDKTSVTFTAQKTGSFEYYCNIPGHRETGMTGTLIVDGAGRTEAVPVTPPGIVSQVVRLEAPKTPQVTDIAASGAIVPLPLTRKAPANVKILLETKEVVAKMADNVTYTFWAYNGTVPGPMIRVLEGDSVTITIKNLGKQPHSIDLHAVTGPGGGAVATQTPPGEQTTFTFKAINPGVYLYHCASPHIPTHIANGLYGLILVEPKEGMSRVDKEFYVVQGEFYTSGKRGQVGHHGFDIQKAWNEQPEYVLFNGRAGALVGALGMKAKVGETVRIYFGNGGPNLASSFHVIGEIFDRVYPDGGLGPASSPQVNVETIMVPPGSGTIVEFKFDVPGRYILVDHAIFRAIDKGAVGIIDVEGPQNPEIFASTSATSTAGH